MFPLTTIYLIRHAEAEGNLYRRIQGWYNSLITGNGFRQIKALEERFRDIPVDAVYSSDLYRTMTTARAIYEPKNLPLQTEPGLREIHLGDWEDQTWGEVRHFDETEMLRFNRSDPTWQAPNGESLKMAGDRMVEAITRLAKKHPNETVAMFSHGAAIRQALSQIMGLTPDHWNDLPHGDNTCVTRIFFDGEQLTVDESMLMDASHLSAEVSTLSKQAWWRKDNFKSQDLSLWFRHADLEQDRDLYLSARKEAWTSTFGEEVPFDGGSLLNAAEQHLSQSPRNLSFAMAGDQVVGVLELDSHRYEEDNSGCISFCYIVPEMRERNLGVQLIGEAVSCFRPMGRNKLRLRCAACDSADRAFYQQYGFDKIGEDRNAPVSLDILEKYIGYDR